MRCDGEEYEGKYQVSEGLFDRQTASQLKK